MEHSNGNSVNAHKSNHHPAHRSQKKRGAIAIVSAFVVVLAAVIVGFFLYSSSPASTIDTSKYQAVFLADGQVYFGKLKPLGSEYLELTDVYYLQSTDENDNTLQESSDDTGNNEVQLIKLGNELHGPEDKMVIVKDQVLFYENLKSDGRVATSIAQYQSQQ